MAETGRYTSATCTTVPSYTLQDDQGTHSASLKCAIQSPFPQHLYTWVDSGFSVARRKVGETEKLLGTGLLGAQSQNSNP